MSDEQPPSPVVAPPDRNFPLLRRSFIGSVAGLGASIVAPSAAGQSWPSYDDPYFAALASDLADRGLPPGEFLFGDTEVESMAAYDVGGAVETTAIDASEELPFQEAMRLSVADSVEDPWDALLKASDPERALEQGDVLLGVAYLRAAPTDDTDPETGADSTIQYLAKDADDAATNQVVNGTQPVLDSEWRRYDFQIRSEHDSDAGDWWTELFLGYGAQTVDVGGLALLHFGDAVSTDALPDWNASYEYAGRADDAAWRSAALDRIEAIRRGPLSVTVTDEAGDPIPDAEVAVEMQRHEFDFGAAVAVDDLTSDETYRETFLEHFETAVIENGLKDPAWAGEYSPGVGPVNTEAAIDWLNDQDVPTRGHALFWADYDHHVGVDEDQSADEVIATIESSIRERTAAMAGRLSEWDAHNHPVMFDSITDDVGREAILDLWTAATDEDPSTPMWVNEGAVLSTLQRNRDAYYEYVDWLTGTGTDVAGIGFMGHFGVDYLRPPAQLLEIFDEFAAFDRPLKVTELDVSIADADDEAQIEAQRDYLRDVLIAAYSHEAVEGIVQWGFWAGSHWQPSAALFDEDWSIRPHGEAYRQLVFEEWWIDERGSTDGEGSYATTAYLGTYRITATVDGQQTVETVVLDDSGAGTSVTLAVDVDEDEHSDCGGAAGTEAATVDGQVVCDVDGDGEYMDVNGDGAVSNGDVTDFFGNQHAPAWDERTELFDFDGDGDVGQGDVVELFHYVN